MKTIGLARLGRDAEVRYLPSGEAVANLSLAVNYYSKGADNNRATQWIDATLWGKQAESMAQYMVKGSVHCFALSDVHIEEFEGRNGAGHKLVARVDSVELGPRQDGGSGQAPAQRPAAGAPARPAPAAQPSRQAPAPQQGGIGPDDDDIPF